MILLGTRGYRCRRVSPPLRHVTSVCIALLSMGFGGPILSVQFGSESLWAMVHKKSLSYAHYFSEEIRDFFHASRYHELLYAGSLIGCAYVYSKQYAYGAVLSHGSFFNGQLLTSALCAFFGGVWLNEKSKYRQVHAALVQLQGQSYIDSFIEHELARQLKHVLSDRDEKVRAHQSERAELESELKHISSDRDRLRMHVRDLGCCVEAFQQENDLVKSSFHQFKADVTTSIDTVRRQFETDKTELLECVNSAKRWYEKRLHHFNEELTARNDIIASLTATAKLKDLEYAERIGVLEKDLAQRMGQVQLLWVWQRYLYQLWLSQRKKNQQLEDRLGRSQALLQAVQKQGVYYKNAAEYLEDALRLCSLGQVSVAPRYIPEIHTAYNIVCDVSDGVLGASTVVVGNTPRRDRGDGSMVSRRSLVRKGTHRLLEQYYVRRSIAQGCDQALSAQLAVSSVTYHFLAPQLVADVPSVSFTGERRRLLGQNRPFFLLPKGRLLLPIW